jgi:hypothetical protein
MRIQTIPKEEKRPLDRGRFIGMEEIRETKPQPDHSTRESEKNNQNEIHEGMPRGIKPFFRFETHMFLRG